MQWNKGLMPHAAYVHVPFCAHHCGYCDFAVVAGQDHLIDLYLQALDVELATLQEPQPVQTLFLGGGTPTHRNARQLQRLLTDLNHWLPLKSDHEFTTEPNPRTPAEHKTQLLPAHRVTRVSPGAHTFHPHLPRLLKRAHDPPDVSRAVERVKARIEQLSLARIFAIPGQ